MNRTTYMRNKEERKVAAGKLKSYCQRIRTGTGDFPTTSEMIGYVEYVMPMMPLHAQKAVVYASMGRHTHA